MNRYLCLALVAIPLLGGFSSPSSNPVDDRGVSMKTMMNVPAGMFQSLLTAYPVTANTQKTDIRLVMTELRFGSEWAPMVSFCLRNDNNAPRPNVCLQFFVSERDHNVQPRQYSRSEGSEKYSIVTLEPRYSVRDPILISISDTSGRTEFWANNERLFSVPAISPSVSLEFSCSSVVCNLEFLK